MTINKASTMSIIEAIMLISNLMSLAAIVILAKKVHRFASSRSFVPSFGCTGWISCTIQTVQEALTNDSLGIPMLGVQLAHDAFWGKKTLNMLSWLSFWLCSVGARR
jgi:hypothetical protein